MTSLTRLTYNTILLAAQGNCLITEARQYFLCLFCFVFLPCSTAKETNHFTTFRISFSIVGNETSRENSVLRDLGVSRSVDGTPRQLRHRAGQSRDNLLRFQARERNSACLLALCTRKLNFVPISNPASTRPPPNSLHPRGQSD